MAFSASLEMNGKTATITLSGELDASVAPVFKAEVEKAAAAHPDRLVLMMKDLEYIASAGIRVFVFAKQKMGAQVQVVAVAPQEQVIETFRMTGIDRSMEITDSLDTGSTIH